MEKFNPENKILKKEGIICRDYRDCDDRKPPLSINSQVETMFTKISSEYPAEFNIDLARIHDEVLGVLTMAGINPIESSMRLKRKDRLLQVIIQKRNLNDSKPVLDIYGITFVFPTKSIARLAKETIEVKYYMPEKFSFGVDTVRTDPGPVSHPGYSVIRMNIFFKSSQINNYPRDFLSIAEIKLMSISQKEMEDKNRQDYERKRGKA